MHYRAAAAFVLLIIAVALVVTTRGWMDWGGDDALYIMNARNIVLGAPYGHTLYLHNALNPIHPAAPPLGFPLLLAPVYAASGFDWANYKLACVAMLLLFLIVFAVLASEWLPKPWALTAVLLIGLHPFTWHLKETIPPEFAFMFFGYGTLWLVDRAIQVPDARTRQLYTAIAAIAIAAAYLTRPIGVVLFPAVVCASFYQTRRLLSPGVICAAAGLALAWGVEELVRPDLGTYVGYLDALGWQSLKANVRAYNVAWRYLLEDHLYARSFRGMALLGFTVVTVLIGFFMRARARLSAFEWFTLGYCALLLIYPVSLEPDRYSYPVWPLILLYALLGCHWIGSKAPQWLRQGPAVLLSVILLVNFLMTYQGIERRVGIDKSRALAADAMYQYIGDLPRSAVVIARLPTVVALVAKRRAATWPLHADAATFRSYMKSIDAQYVLYDSDFPATHPSRTDELTDFIHGSSQLLLLHASGPFMLYRLGS